MTLFRFDDPDQYLDGTPYSTFARLRKESAFSWHTAPPHLSDGFWLATKHCDIISISKQPDLFATNAPLLDDPLPKDLWPRFPALGMIADNLMTFEAAKHVIFRSLANALFSTSRLGRKKDKMHTICRERIKQASHAARFDFATDIALAIAIEVILGEFLGIPEPDLGKVAQWILTVNAMDDPVYRPTSQSLFEAAEKLFDYGLKLMEYLKVNPGDNVLSEVVCSSEIEGASREQLFLAYWFPLAAGAFDTTASVIAGGVHALLEFPRQFDLLKEDHRAISTAVEEMVRWVSPVVYFRRTATTDTEFNGKAIRKAQKIILCYASANRDEDVFVNPDFFDVKRAPNNHLSFGYGSHFCLGARVAQLILRIFLEEFLAHMPELRMNGTVLRTRSSWMNRIRSMPVQKAPCCSIAARQTTREEASRSD